MFQSNQKTVLSIFEFSFNKIFDSNTYETKCPLLMLIALIMTSAVVYVSTMCIDKCGSH